MLVNSYLFVCDRKQTSRVYPEGGREVDQGGEEGLPGGEAYLAVELEELY